MVATRPTRHRPERFTIRDVTKGLKTIAYWNGVLADLMSQPDVRMFMLGNIDDFAKGPVGGWPPIAEKVACRMTAPIPTGKFAVGEAGEVLYALRDCTHSIATILARLPRGMELSAPRKLGPRVTKRTTAAGRPRAGRAAATSKRPAARKRAAPKPVKRSK
jgi:hypothetical protein